MPNAAPIKLIQDFADHRANYYIMAHDLLDPKDRKLTADTMLRAYAAGIFPMSDAADHPHVFWVDPTQRGIFPLDGFHVARSLRRQIRQGGFQVLVNHDFAGTVTACADREETWINADIFNAYQDLHRRGHAHSVEVWQNGALAGAVFGLSIAGAFFGESMVSPRTNGSKIALTYLVARLKWGGFHLFDTQFITPHLQSLGAVEIPRLAYQARLKHAMGISANFWAHPPNATPDDVLSTVYSPPSPQDKTQTS